MSGLLRPSPVGPLWLTAEGGALTGCWLLEGRYLPPMPDAPPTQTDDPVLRSADRWLDAYFAGHDPGLTPPLAPAGSPFRQEVWALLQTIPWGGLTSYGALAAQLAARRGIPKMSARAVGGAVGANPLSIFIPCHRVVGAHGSLTGYGGGLHNKVLLLRLEGIELPGRD